MSEIFQKLGAERDKMLAGVPGAQRRVSVLFALIEASHRFSEAVGTHAELEAALEDAREAIALLREDGGDAAVTGWLESAAEHVAAVDFESFAEWLAELEWLDGQLWTAGLSDALLERLVQRQYEALWGRIAYDVPPDVLFAGHLERVADAAWGLVEGTVPMDEALALLAAVRETLSRTRQSHSELYVLDGEWTIEVAMADQLLAEGTAEWLAGLDRLESICRDGLTALVEDELSALMDANRKLVYLERLSGLF